VDDRIGLFGSANFDVRSLFVNFEVGILTHSESDVAAMTAWAETLTPQCRAPTIELQTRKKIFGNVAEDVSRLLAPLL
jgi:cardiolipin synthase